MENVQKKRYGFKVGAVLLALLMLATILAINNAIYSSLAGLKELQDAVVLFVLIGLFWSWAGVMLIDSVPKKHVAKLIVLIAMIFAISFIIMFNRAYGQIGFDELFTKEEAKMVVLGIPAFLGICILFFSFPLKDHA